MGAGLGSRAFFMVNDGYPAGTSPKMAGGCSRVEALAVFSSRHPQSNKPHGQRNQAFFTSRFIALGKSSCVCSLLCIR